MNKQEYIELLEASKSDGSGMSDIFNNGLDVAKMYANQIDEPKECEIEETERNDYASDFTCSCCKKSFDLFRWVNAPNSSVKFCPNCGAKIKTQKGKKQND